MTSPFQRILPKRPPRIVSLKPGHFRQGSEGSPNATDRVGIRHLSVFEAQRAVAEAKQSENYEFELMLNVVASSLTLADDVTQPLLRVGALECQRLFTPQGVKYLYDIVEQLHAETHPLYEEASDAQIDKICTLLKDPKVWQRLGKRGTRVRRLLTYVLDYLLS